MVEPTAATRRRQAERPAVRAAPGRLPACGTVPRIRSGRPLSIRPHPAALPPGSGQLMAAGSGSDRRPSVGATADPHPERTAGRVPAARAAPTTTAGRSAADLDRGDGASRPALASTRAARPTAGPDSHPCTANSDRTAATRLLTADSDRTAAARLVATDPARTATAAGARVDAADPDRAAAAAARLVATAPDRAAAARLLTAESDRALAGNLGRRDVDG